MEGYKYKQEEVEHALKTINKMNRVHTLLSIIFEFLSVETYSLNEMGEKYLKLKEANEKAEILLKEALEEAKNAPAN